MHDFVEQFRKELLAIYTFQEDTVQNYISVLYRYVAYAKEHNYQSITGPAIIAYQFHLKKQRLNCGASINRKIFTLICKKGSRFNQKNAFDQPLAAFGHNPK